MVRYITVLCSLVPLSLSWANPQDPVVVAGDVSMESGSSKLSIVASDKAIINWGDFSIAAGEVTSFVQPSSHAVVLNRVTGALSSQILGALEANGKVFLINPNGIIVGESGSIDTGHFIASTLDLSDYDYLSKKELLFQGDSNTILVNLGTITAWDGDVVLLARAVENRGSIKAPHGSTLLAAGQEILLKPSGQERIFIHPSTNRRAETHVSTSGEISALQVELKADGNPYSFAINQTGNIDAVSVAERHGRIFLVAGDGNVRHTGTSFSDGDLVKVEGREIILGDPLVEKGGGGILAQGDGSLQLILQGEEKIRIEDGYAVTLTGGSLSAETALGDIEIIGAIKAQDASPISIHAAKDIRIGDGSQKYHSRIENQKGPITLVADQDVYLLASGARVSQVASHGNANITINAGRDGILYGGKENSARAYIFSKGNLSFTTGRHLTLDSLGGGYAALGAAHEVTVVIDNIFSTPPQVGPGALVMGPNTRMQGESLRLFTAKQSNNSIEGALNLKPFLPGAEYASTAEEMWGTYFYSASGGTPFTIYYKDIRVSLQVTDLFNIAATEFLQEMRDFDEFFYLQKSFCERFDKEAYAKLSPHSILPNLRSFRDRCYRMLRETNKDSGGLVSGSMVPDLL